MKIEIVECLEHAKTGRAPNAERTQVLQAGKHRLGFEAAPHGVLVTAGGEKAPFSLIPWSNVRLLILAESEKGK